MDLDMDKLNSVAFHHKEHKEWLSNLNFHQDEIKIFQNELLAVLHRNQKNLSIIEHVDEYRRILIKKLESLDELRRQIILQERELSTQLKLSSDVVWDHQELRRQMQEFEKDFEIMKENLRRFAAYND
jgi:hypothetical protein